MQCQILHSYSIQQFIHKLDNHLKKHFQPTVAFVYLSSSFSVPQLITALRPYAFVVIGATTAGEIFADKEHGMCEVEESLVCMLLDIDPHSIAFKLLNVYDKEYENVGKAVGRWANHHFQTNAVITLTAGLVFDNDAYTKGIQSEKIEYIFGGAAGDDLRLNETFVFSKDEFTSHGVVALAINRDKIEVIGARAFGWKGIGKERIVTLSDKNMVYKIDGKPAIDFYKNYLNVTVEDMPQMGIEYPLEVTMHNGQVVYRAVLELDEATGALIFAGHVEQKSKVRLSLPAGRTIIDHVGRSIQESIEKANGFCADVALVFPCCSRKQVLGDLTILEIEVAAEAAKAPLIGFFAYGEIGAFPGGCGFHNETFVTALLREKVTQNVV